MFKLNIYPSESVVNNILNDKDFKKIAQIICIYFLIKYKTVFITINYF